MLLRQHGDRGRVEVHERGGVVQLGKRVEEGAQVLEDDLRDDRRVEQRESAEERLHHVCTRPAPRLRMLAVYADV